jgi:hypothetical protein
MILLLRDVRDYVASLNIAEDENCYCGKLPDKKQKSIGTYPLTKRQNFSIPLGGVENGTHGEKTISFLIHWNKSPTESEKAAFALQEALEACRNVTINQHKILFTRLSYDEPIPVATDDDGIYEYVIECIFYYREEE